MHLNYSALASKRLLLVAVALCLAFAGNTLAESPSKPPALTFATNAWPPLILTDKTGPLLDIIGAVTAHMGYQAQHQFFPWPRCEYMVTAGSVYAAFPYGYTEARAKKYDYSDLICSAPGESFFFYKRSQSEFSYESIDDLKNYKMLGVSGYSHVERLQKSGVPVKVVGDEKLAVHQLRMGHADLLILPTFTGITIIESEFPNETADFGTLEKPFMDNKFYLIVSRSYPDSGKLTAAFNRAMGQLKTDGTFKRLFDKHNLGKYGLKYEEP